MREGCDFVLVGTAGLSEHLDEFGFEWTGDRASRFAGGGWVWSLGEELRSEVAGDGEREIEGEASACRLRGLVFLEFSEERGKLK